MKSFELYFMSIYIHFFHPVCRDQCENQSWKLGFRLGAVQALCPEFFLGEASVVIWTPSLLVAIGLAAIYVSSPQKDLTVVSFLFSSFKWGVLYSRRSNLLAYYVETDIIVTQRRKKKYDQKKVQKFQLFPSYSKDYHWGNSGFPPEFPESSQMGSQENKAK